MTEIKDPHRFKPGGAEDLRDLHAALCTHSFRRARLALQDLAARRPGRIGDGDLQAHFLQGRLLCNDAVRDLEPHFLKAHRDREARVVLVERNASFLEQFRDNLS